MRQLYKNAFFHQMDKLNNLANAILVENGKIAEVYQASSANLTDAEIIDLKGCHVYPGFIDTHTHSFEGGLYSQSLDLSVAVTMKQVLQMLNEYYETGRANKAEQLDAFRFDENKIDAVRFPSRQELDMACPDIPLVLRRIDGHSSVVNSSAWKSFRDANQDFLAKDNSGYGKDDLTLRGELNDKLVHWFHGNCSEQTIINAYEQASKIALSNGITTVHTMVGDSQDSIMHFKFLRDNLSKFDVEYILYPQSFNLQAALEAGATRIGGCILADGSLGSYTAALRKPYENKPTEFGRLYQDDSFWLDFITEATRNKLQVGIHCIGDRAIKQINDVYLKLTYKFDYDLRHQLIHCELTPDDLLEEIVSSRAIPVMQPAFDMYWGAELGYYHQVLGETRRNQMNRFNTFSQKGVKITGGSDWYVTELDALQGINSAINHHNASERLDKFEAISMYTVNAAHLSHDENRLGRIEAGYDADFVCLQSDIQSSAPLNSDIVACTIKKGRQVFSK